MFCVWQGNRFEEVKFSTVWTKGLATSQAVKQDRGRRAVNTRGKRGIWRGRAGLVRGYWAREWHGQSSTLGRLTWRRWERGKDGSWGARRLPHYFGAEVIKVLFGGREDGQGEMDGYLTGCGRWWSEVYLQKMKSDHSARLNGLVWSWSGNSNLTSNPSSATW